MNTNKTTARIVGVLFIIGTVAGIVSLAFGGNIIDDPDYLVKVSANEDQFMIGALLVLIMGLALSMIPAVVFPVFKKYNEALAMGYVVFRGALEASTYIATVIGWLALIALSQEFVNAGAPDATYFQTLGALVLEALDAIGYLMTIVFCLGALMFYWLWYQSKLIPRWLSGWGLIGAVLHLVEALLVMFGVFEPFSAVDTILFLPLAVNEMVLALWLIVKGFSSQPVATGSS